MMNFGFSTLFFVKKHILDILDDIVSSGIRVIELSYEIPHALDMDNVFLSKVHMLKEKGVEFAMHAPFFEINLGSFFNDIREISREKIRLSLDLAHRIGCDPVVVHPGYTFLMDKLKGIEDKTREAFIEDLKNLAIYAKERNLRIALENVHMPFFFFYELRDFKELYEIIPDIGIALDIGHAYITKCSKGEKDPEGAIIEDLRVTGIENVFHVHIHNNTGKRDDHHFMNGNMDMKRILRSLKEAGYGGKVIIESSDMEEYGITPVLKKLKDITP
jgi:sugar phosphate isomerase/epimerase